MFLAKNSLFPRRFQAVFALSAFCWWSCHLDLSEACAKCRNCHVCSHCAPLSCQKVSAALRRFCTGMIFWELSFSPILPLLFDLFPWGFGLFKPWQMEGWVEVNRRLSLFQLKSKFLVLTFKLNPTFKLDELYWRVDLGVAVRLLLISLLPPVPCINPMDVLLSPEDFRL